ncbi:MAG: alpha/beta hydrolase-fold protein [Isosphaeraceae bacterium]
MFLVALCMLGQFPTITPSEVRDALRDAPTGIEAQALALRVRSVFPPGTDLKRGGHAPLRDEDAMLFVLEARPGESPRIEGVMNHGQGWNMERLGETRLWVHVATVPRAAKFSYNSTAGLRRLGGGVVEMPGWSSPPEAAARPRLVYGEYQPMDFTSTVYGDHRNGWVYVPNAVIESGELATLTVFLDGDAYRRAGVATMVENLIADQAIPPTILLGLNPGRRPDGTSNRSLEYDAPGPKLARFLETDVLPILFQFPLKPGAGDRAVVGASSGGLGAFNLARERPDLFGRVAAQLGRFTVEQDGQPLSDIVRGTDQKEPLTRIVLTTGPNDLIDESGDWWQSTLALATALRDKGSKPLVVIDDGFHNFWTCTRQLPVVLKQLWGQE